MPWKCTLAGWLVRRQNETDLVAGLRTEKNRASALLLESYESAHPPIAAGTPTLTRQQADAAIDLFYFMAGQLEGVQAGARGSRAGEVDVRANGRGEGLAFGFRGRAGSGFCQSAVASASAAATRIGCHGRSGSRGVQRLRCSADTPTRQ